jgi:hypothetical protein
MVLWRLALGNSGFIDKLFGGVARRGRTNRHEIHSDVLILRVLYANKEEGKLVLYAEMKLPTGMARIQNNK